jgi:hypothetical protein
VELYLPEPGWTLWRREKCLLLSGTDTDSSVKSATQSLYPLSYPANIILIIIIITNAVCLAVYPQGRTSIRLMPLYRQDMSTLRQLLLGIHRRQTNTHQCIFGATNATVCGRKRAASPYVYGEGMLPTNMNIKLDLWFSRR